MNDQTGARLIRELLGDPQKFDDDGRAYDLLQAYFAGFPLETLRPLLRSNDVFVQRAAAFVASELGGEAWSLVDDVVPLLRSMDRHVPYYAMEVLTVCCEGVQADKFAHVVRMLESNDDVLRALAMRLVSNAAVSQVEAAQRRFEGSTGRVQTHREGLRTLVAGSQTQPGVVAAMIHDADPLVRRYGAIAAKRLLREFPTLMTEVGASSDTDLGKFYQGVKVQESGTPQP